MAGDSPDDLSPDDPAGQEGSHVPRNAVVFCGIAVVALVAAVIVFAVSGAPYAHSIAGGALYAGGLLVGLIGAVLLWMSWAELREDVSPGRLRWGLVTTAASLLLVCACAVVAMSKVVSGNVQLGLISATALVLALALAAVGQARAGGDRVPGA